MGDKWGFIPFATDYIEGMPKKYRIPGHWKRQREMLVVATCTGMELGARLMRADLALVEAVLADLGPDAGDVAALLENFRRLQEGEHGDTGDG